MDIADLKSAFENLLISDEPTCSDNDLQTPVVISDEVSFSAPFSSISAGSSITLNEATGTWPTLIQEDQTDPESISEYYFAQGPRAGLLPTDTVMGIPGGMMDGQPSIGENVFFPSFSDILLPQQNPLEGITISTDIDGNASSESEITWLPGTNTEQLMQIRMSQYKGFEDGRANFDGITCTTPDDGNFSVPDALKYVFSVDDRSAYSIFLYRTKVSVVRKDDAVLLISNDASGELDIR